MDTFIVIAVYVVGLGLMVTELLLPGVILGLIGLGCVVASVAFAFGVLKNPALGGWLTGIAVFVVPALIVLWIRIIDRYFSVKSSEKGYTSSEEGLGDLLGREGTTLTALRPAGVALFGDRRVDVVSTGEMIGKDMRVKVVEVKGNRVVVRNVTL